MIVTAKNNKQINIRKFSMEDVDNLTRYFSQLSETTKRRYGPHPFEKQSIVEVYTKNEDHCGFVAYEVGNTSIIAYSIVRLGTLPQDRDRLYSYGLTLHEKTDATFAPSVADDWQSTGIGSSIFYYVVSELKQKGVCRIILWGGVQSSNEKAVNFYKKHGFQTLGKFEHNGPNYDMALEISAIS